MDFFNPGDFKVEDYTPTPRKNTRASAMFAAADERDAERQRMYENSYNETFKQLKDYQKQLGISNPEHFAEFQQKWGDDIDALAEEASKNTRHSRKHEESLFKLRQLITNKDLHRELGKMQAKEAEIAEEEKILEKGPEWQNVVYNTKNAGPLKDEKGNYKTRYKPRAGRMTLDEYTKNFYKEAGVANDPNVGITRENALLNANNTHTRMSNNPGIDEDLGSELIYNKSQEDPELQAMFNIWEGGADKEQLAKNLMEQSNGKFNYEQAKEIVNQQEQQYNLTKKKLVKEWKDKLSGYFADQHVHGVKQPQGGGGGGGAPRTELPPANKLERTAYETVIYNAKNGDVLDEGTVADAFGDGQREGGPKKSYFKVKSPNRIHFVTQGGHPGMTRALQNSLAQVGGTFYMHANGHRKDFDRLKGSNAIVEANDFMNALKLMEKMNWNGSHLSIKQIKNNLNVSEIKINGKTYYQLPASFDLLGGTKQQITDVKNTPKFLWSGKNSAARYFSTYQEALDYQNKNGGKISGV